MHRQRGRQPENRQPAPFYEARFYRRSLSAVSSRAAAPAAEQSYLPVCSVILRFSADLSVLDRHRRPFDPGDPGDRSVSIPGDPDALRLG